MNFAVMEKLKKGVQVAMPSRSLLPQHGAMFPQNTVDRSLPGTDIKTNLGHDFSRISVMPSKSPVDSTGFQPVAQPCPLGLVSPRACPFGGACHTCPVSVQTKLAISQPGDVYEQEADRVAEQVIQTSGLKLQRYAAGPIRSDVVPPIVHEVLNSSGQPLDSETRSFMETRFGYDFSKVRVHTDARATESAQAMNALAYAVGGDIVFDANRYSPDTNSGKQLLGHELTHVVQQGNADLTLLGKKEMVTCNENSLEAEADVNARYLGSGILTTRSSNVEPSIMRRGQQQRQRRPGCTNIQDAAIDEARAAAAIRCQVASFRLSGLVAPGPPGREQEPSQNWRLRARSLVLRIFNQNLNMDQVTEIVGRMRDRLSSTSLQVVCTGNNDPNCGNRAGYVIGRQPPIYLCPVFFNSTAEERIRTMIHEGAHLAGIGEALGETYCPIFDCESSCGGFNVADAWSQFVHCLSGQPADQPEVIEARRK